MAVLAAAPASGQLGGAESRQSGAAALDHTACTACLPLSRRRRLSGNNTLLIGLDATQCGTATLNLSEIGCWKAYRGCGWLTAAPRKTSVTPQEF